MIYLSCCVIAGVSLAVIFLAGYYRAWQQVTPNSPNLWQPLWQEINRLLPTILFWMPLGSIFGGIGVVLMMKFVGIPLADATGWMAIGVIAGAIWGLVWGIIYGLTER